MPLAQPASQSAMPPTPTTAPTLQISAGTQPVEEPTAEFLAELAEQSERLESATPEEIITWAHGRFGDGLTMGTAFGPEGCVILSMLAEIAPETYVFNLDTGYQFQQTLDLRERIAEKYGIHVDMLQPELTVIEYEDQTHSIQLDAPERLTRDIVKWVEARPRN